MSRTKYEEYLICEDRGHRGTFHYGVDTGQKLKCEYCGTIYWTEYWTEERTKKHEENVPKPEVTP